MSFAEGGSIRNSVVEEPSGVRSPNKSEVNQSALPVSAHELSMTAVSLAPSATPSYAGPNLAYFEAEKRLKKRMTWANVATFARAKAAL